MQQCMLLPGLHVVVVFFDESHLIQIFDMLFVLTMEYGLMIPLVRQLSELVLSQGIITVLGDGVVQQDLNGIFRNLTTDQQTGWSGIAADKVDLIGTVRYLKIREEMQDILLVLIQEITIHRILTIGRNHGIYIRLIDHSQQVDQVDDQQYTI